MKKIDCSETETAAKLFFLSAKKHPEKTALEWYDTQQNRVVGVTYGALFSEVMALGSELYGRGLKGKRVALIGDKKER